MIKKVEIADKDKDGKLNLDDFKYMLNYKPSLPNIQNNSII